MDDKKKLLLTQYATTHGLIDLICAASLFSLWHQWKPSDATAMHMFLVYNVITFGLQVPLGILVDKFNQPKLSAILGCCLVALGVLFVSVSPYLCIILIGIGNALFHVGGGSISFELTPNKASAPGIFVGPGAIGLTIGILIGQANAMNKSFFVFLLILMILVLLKLPVPKKEVEQKFRKGNIDNRSVFFLVLILILIVVCVRSLVGFSIAIPWKKDVLLFLILQLSISAGKGFGGVLADRFGWMNVGLFGLIVSTPFLLIFTKIPLLFIIASFLFQFTMPVTLVAVYKLFPQRPAFAFGLPCLALLVGALPKLFGNTFFVNKLYLIVCLVLIAVASLCLGLRLLNKNSKLIRL